MVAVSAISELIKQLNPTPTSPANHVVINSWLTTLPGEIEPFQDHPSTRERLNKLHKQATAETGATQF